MRDFSRDEKTVRRRKRALAERGPVMGAEELEVNHGVLRRMNEKLQFMRNPRHDGTSSSTAARSLLRPPPAVPDTNDDTVASVTMEKAEGELGHFLGSPPGLLFDDYKIGVVYEQVLLLRNVSSIEEAYCQPPRTSPSNALSMEQTARSHLAWHAAACCVSHQILSPTTRITSLFSPRLARKAVIEAKREPPNSLSRSHLMLVTASAQTQRQRRVN